jgi:hypothetical protein
MARRVWLVEVPLLMMRGDRSLYRVEADSEEEARAKAISGRELRIGFDQEDSEVGEIISNSVVVRPAVGEEVDAKHMVYDEATKTWSIG